MKVAVEGAPAPKENSWVEVTGTWILWKHGIPHDYAAPTMAAATVTAVEQPAEPYERVGSTTRPSSCGSPSASRIAPSAQESVKPGFRPLLITSGVVLVILAVATLAQDRFRSIRTARQAELTRARIVEEAHLARLIGREPVPAVQAHSPGHCGASRACGSAATPPMP